MFLKYLETKNVLIFPMFLAVFDARLKVLKIQMFLFGFVQRQEMFLKTFFKKFKNVKMFLSLLGLESNVLKSQIRA